VRCIALPRRRSAHRRRVRVSAVSCVEQDGGKIEEAVVCYRKALELKPYFPDAYSNLVHSLVLVCDWKTRNEDFASLAKLLDDQVVAAMAYSASALAPTSEAADVAGMRVTKAASADVCAGSHVGRLPYVMCVCVCLFVCLFVTQQRRFRRCPRFSPSTRWCTR
jgi:hypothetical protein